MFSLQLVIVAQHQVRIYQPYLGENKLHIGGKMMMSALY
jgi:hypothetical protein